MTKLKTCPPAITQLDLDTMPPLENIGYIAALLTTLAFLPQAILTLRTRNTSGISFFMYLLFTLGVACWLIYGVVIGDLAIILANAVTVLLAANILVVKTRNLWSGRDGGTRGEP